MTVEANDTVERYTVSGVGPYAFSFRVFDEDEISVVVDTGDIDPVPLTLTTHYTVSGVDDGNGGTITLTAGAAAAYAGDVVDIRSNTAEYQPTSIRNQGRFLPEIHEDAFDRLSRQVQDLSRRVDRKFGYPDNTALDGTMVLRSTWADKWVYVNSDGELEPASSITAQALSQSIVANLLNPRTPAEVAAGVTPADTTVPSDLTGVVLEGRYASAADAVLVVAQADLKPLAAGGFRTGALAPATSSQFYSRESITDHAHYGFLDDSLIAYAGGAPIYGHASFDDNVSFTGSVASDHHHSFQSYPHYGAAATITRIAGFYSIGDVTAGMVVSYAGLWVDDPTGAGAINNLYGVYIAPLDRGTGNSYAFYSEGQTKSCLGGPLQFGAPATPAVVQYNYNTGYLDLIPRGGYSGVYKIHAQAELLIGGPNEASAASILNDLNTTDLVITPRTGGNTTVASPLEATGPITLPAYTVAQLGSTVLPASWPRAMVYVSNETGGATVAYSNGTNWKRVYDNANIS